MQGYDAQDPEVLGALTEALRRFMAAWNVDDGSGVTLGPYFVHPWALVTPEGLSIMAAPEDTAAFYAAKKAEVAAQGWAQSTIDDETLYALEENLGVMTFAWSRRDADGRPFVSGRSFYTFIRVDGAWRITSVMFNY